MRGRDLLILAAVLLLGGFAVADGLRRIGGEEAPREAAATTATGGTTTVATTGEEPGPRSYPPVPGAGGAVVITEAGSCAVREFDLPTGLEFRSVVARSTCQLWAAPVTAKVAVGIGEPVGDAVPIRFIDLSRPGVNLGTSEAAFGFLAWSQDGQRAAWCNRRLVGIDLELGRGRRLLPECPAAFTPEHEVAFASGPDVVVDGQTVLTASGDITNVHYATDDSRSVAVVVEGRRVERYVDRRLTDAFDLPERLEGRLPTLSPDNCAALFRAGNLVRLVDLGCSSVREQGFPGYVGAWSPDGAWIAVGEADRLTFHELATGESIQWDVGTVEIAWRRG